MSSTGIQEKEAKKIRQRRGITRPVKAPLGRISFKYYVYILSVVTIAWAVYYAYRTLEIQRTSQQSFKDNLRRSEDNMRGFRGDPPSAKQNIRDNLQQKIEDLSVMLGVEPVVLASAIAGVIKSRMPAASSSSIVNQAKASGSVLSAFADGMNEASSVPVPTTTSQLTDATTEGGVAASVLSAVKNAGFDDMGMDMD